MAIKKGVIITTIITYLLLMGISIFCYSTLDNAFDHISMLLVALTFTVLIALIPICTKTLHVAKTEDTPALPYYPRSQRWFILVLNQTLLLLAGGIFLFGGVLQSHVSPKSPALPFEALIPLFKERSTLCLFLPWVVISALSVLANHRSYKTNSMLWLPGLSIGLAPHHPKKFFLSAYNDILNMIITTVGIVLLCIAIGLACESLGQAQIVDSAWKTPMRNGLFMFIVLMFSYRYRENLLKKYARRHYSLGAVFFVQGILLVLALFGFEVLLLFTDFAIEEATLLKNPPPPMELGMTVRSLGTVLMLFPLFLIPYLVPLFARLNLGLRAWQAFLMPLIIPAALFLWLLPHYVDSHAFLSFIERLKEPLPLFSLGMLGLFIVYFLFQHVRQHFDLHIGRMPLINPPYKNPNLYLIARTLTKGVLSWMAMIFIGGWFTIYLSFYGIGLALLFALNITAICFLTYHFRNSDAVVAVAH